MDKATLKQLPFDVIKQQVEKRNNNETNATMHSSVVRIKSALNGFQLDEVNTVMCGLSKVQKPLMVAGLAFWADSLETGKNAQEILGDAIEDVQELEIKD
jgi:hypothetical protein